MKWWKQISKGEVVETNGAENHVIISLVNWTLKWIKNTISTLFDPSLGVEAKRRKGI
jgi:hypothetical protein